MNPSHPVIVEKPKPPPAPLMLRVLFKPVDLALDLHRWAAKLLAGLALMVLLGGCGAVQHEGATNCEARCAAAGLAVDGVVLRGLVTVDCICRRPATDGGCR